MAFFDGYMKITLDGEDEKALRDGLELTGDWITKRRRILSRERAFKVTFHIHDTDGDRRGLNTVEFKCKGGERELARVISVMGSDFAEELDREHGVDVDLTKSKAVIRA